MMLVICWKWLFSFFCANKNSLMILEGMLFSDDISIVFNCLNFLQSHDTGIVKLPLIFQFSSKYVSQSLSSFQLSGLKDELSSKSKDSNSLFVLIIHNFAKNTTFDKKEHLKKHHHQHPYFQRSFWISKIVYSKQACSCFKQKSLL